MTKRYFKRLGLMALMAGMALTADAQCTNGNLEDGNLNSWTTWYGAYTTANENMIPGIITVNANSHRNTVEIEPVADNNNLITDWWIQNQLLKIFEGNRAVRIGDINNAGINSPWANSTMAAYTFTVTNSNKDFKFWYALEMLNGGHTNPDTEQPDFSWFMKLGAGTLTNAAIPTGAGNPSWNLYNLTKFRRVLPTNPATDPWWVKANPPAPANIWFRQWSCQRYDLSPWLGQQVTIYFRTRDCSFNGHYAYAYVDGLCGDLPPTPLFTLPGTVCRTPETPILLDGSASMNEDSYRITIHELPPAGQGINMTTWYEQTFYGSVGTVDIRQLYRYVGGATRFVCGKTYRVYLNVDNSCGGNGMAYKDIAITCPAVNAGPDKTVCCGAAVSLGSKIINSPNIFSWNPIPTTTTFTPTSLLSFYANQSGTYTLTATGPDGCQNSDAATVTVKRDFSIQAEESCPTGTALDNAISSCAGFYMLNANVTELPCNGSSAPGTVDYSQYTFTWTYNGVAYTGRSIPVPPYVNGQEQVKLDVSNGCYAKTLLYTIPCPKFEGEVPVVIFPNVMAPTNGTNPEAKIMRIRHFGDIPNYWIGAPHAYNSYGYRLMVWDRWGGTVYDKKVLDYTGLEQGEILWNGRFGGTGSVLQNGVYNFKLWLYNCSYPQGKLVVTTYSYHCLWQYWLFGWTCGESHNEIWTNPDGTFDINIAD